MKKTLLLAAVGLMAASSTIDAAKVYFDNEGTGWEKVFGYSWSPDYLKELSTEVVDGHTLYVAELNNEEIIFRGSKDQWADHLQTANLSVEDGAVYGKASLKSNEGSPDPIAHIVNGQYVENSIVNTYPEMYLVGAMTGWGSSAKYRMTTDDGVTYTLTCDIEAGAEFKFYGGAWGTRELTMNSKGTDLGDGTYDLTEGDANMSLKNGGTVTFTLVQSNNFANAKLTISGAGVVEPDQFTTVYFLSDRNGFHESPSLKMATTDGITYTLNIPDAGSDIAFKFLVKTPTPKYFSNGEQNIQNGTYTIEGDVPTNMTFHTGGNVDITLENIDNFSSIKVTIEGQDPDADPYPPIYLVGEMTEWEAEEAYRLHTEDGVNYTITVPNMSGNDAFKFMGGDAHNYWFSNGEDNMEDGTYELNTTTSYNMSLANGGDVTFTFVLGDMHQTATLTIEGQGEVIPDTYPAMYLTSERYGWGARDALKMKTEDGITYTLTVPDMSKQPFHFFGGKKGVRELSMENKGYALANGEYDLTEGDALNMSLGVGGNVTFILVQSNDFTTAKLTIEGQEGEVERNISYQLRGEFNQQGSWVDLPAMTPVEGEENLWTTTFTPKYSGGQFGLKLLVNGSQLEWLNEDVTFSAENPSATLTLQRHTDDGINCKFDFPANVTYTATFNSETDVLSFAVSQTPITPTDLTLYLIGNIVPETGWNSPNDNYKFSTTDGKIYTYTGKLEGGKTFKIYPGNWDDKEHNYGGAGGGAGLENQEYQVYADGGDMTLKYGGENVTLTLDTEALKLTIAGQDEEIVVEKIVTYAVHGQWDGLTDNDWNDIKLEKVSDTEWTANYTPKETGGSFGVRKMENDAQTGWYSAAVTFNADNTSATLSGGGNCTFGYDANTPCKFTFNPETLVLSIVKDTATGIEEISSDYSDAIFFNLQGIKVENPESGLYIMVRNGKSQKVVVK
ncbi:MAG: hypothetical protein K2N05_01215 [Muribaculaceae bacterium]|nr:hypothetical protein [Muribaculaceae bacterium]